MIVQPGHIGGIFSVQLWDWFDWFGECYDSQGYVGGVGVAADAKTYRAYSAYQGDLDKPLAYPVKSRPEVEE
jgi:hypothetical protein